MLFFIIKRFFHTILLLLGISFLIFSSLYIAPGDPASIIAGEGAEQSDIDAVRRQLGLDASFASQYLRYMRGLLQGDLGYSYISNTPVKDTLKISFPATLNLATLSTLFAIILGVGLGVLGAVKKGKGIDYLGQALSLVGISIPSFWLGMMLILLFNIRLHWFPLGGITAPFWTAKGFHQIFLPALTLALASGAFIMRMTRSSTLDVLYAPFVKTARSKGLGEFRVIIFHVLRNAFIPVITIIGLNLGFLLGGAMITEQVFVINGIGRVLINAIQTRDFPLVQGAVMIITVFFVGINLLVDLLYGILDPRIRYE